MANFIEDAEKSIAKVDFTLWCTFIESCSEASKYLLVFQAVDVETEM
jgi:hypothetical protein